MTIDIKAMPYKQLIDQLIPQHEILLPQPAKGHASVLVPIFQRDQQWHILLTVRASHLRHHGGEVAFPGGMWEATDQSPMETALRESEEELDLAKDHVLVMGGLKEMSTRRMTWVRPIVGLIPDKLPLAPNKGEIASTFTVPLDFFKRDQRLRTDLFTREFSGQQQQHWVPAYQFEGYEIWGFTAAVIVDLMNRCFEANIRREHSAPEKIW